MFIQLNVHNKQSIKYCEYVINYLKYTQSKLHGLLKRERRQLFNATQIQATITLMSATFRQSTAKKPTNKLNLMAFCRCFFHTMCYLLIPYRTGGDSLEIEGGIFIFSCSNI